MPKVTKVCRVCGKSYEACRTARTGSGAFRWQEVACSPECGAEYLQKVQASRVGVTTVKAASTPVVSSTVEKTVESEVTRVPFVAHVTPTPAVVSEEVVEEADEVAEDEASEEEATCEAVLDAIPDYNLEDDWAE